MQAYFDQLDRVRYEGSKSSNPLAFRHYNPDELVMSTPSQEWQEHCVEIFKSYGLDSKIGG